MAAKITIRPGTNDDLPFMKEMLYEAAYWRSDQVRPSLDVGLSRPDLRYLLEGWGRAGDTAVISIQDYGGRTGAAWYRFWDDEHHSYGYLSTTIPEVAMAVRPGFRSRGIGKRLLDSLLATAARQGIAMVSLSVELDNFALNLYKKVGFLPVRKVENSWTMAASTGDDIPDWLVRESQMRTKFPSS